MFIATHDYSLARYFDVRENKSTPVMFHNMMKNNDGNVICNSSPEYIKLPDNLLETASAELFKAVVADAMGVQDLRLIYNIFKHLHETGKLPEKKKFIQ